ncbi:heavy metal translocating P-type ATPase [bacterium]|nr:heavy metal translocating P-type ATPase [bacterium]
MDVAASQHVTDPVCGMTVTTQVPDKIFYNNQTYYFCCDGCKNTFEQDPEHHLNKPKLNFDCCPTSALPSIKPGEKTYYTCPMHLEIKQDKPGICPKCGMALELVGGIDAENIELKSMQKRFWVSLAFNIPLFLLAMLPMMGLRKIIPLTVFQSHIAELILALPILTWGAWPFYERAILSIKHQSANMFTLIGMGVLASLLYSLAAVFYPEFFPVIYRTHHGTVGTYFEAAATIITLVLLGQVLELRAREKTSKAISGLLSLAPKTALLIVNGEAKEIALEQVKEGDRLKVLEGARIPVDGDVLSGESTVDESMMTGESFPIDKVPGDAVLGGTINLSKILEIRATKVGTDSMLSQIVQAVQKASMSRAPLQNRADMLAKYFVPIVFLVSFITILVWALWGPAPGYVYGLINAVSVLLIACPCAFGLATPVSIVVGMGRAAGLGILFKNAETLERLGDTQHIVVDKTGTLTEGKPVIDDILVSPDFGRKRAVSLALALEQNSRHPLAHAFKQLADPLSEVLLLTDVANIPGRGLKAMLNHQEVLFGNEKLIDENNIPKKEFAQHIERLKKEGKTLLLLAFCQKLVAIFGAVDPVKESTPRALKLLSDLKIPVTMLTGDQPMAAKRVADSLNIPFEAGLMPQDKLAFIKKLQEAGTIVAMAGDGINDAPGLTQANIGIAMGNGSDLAIEAAGVTLVKGDLEHITKAILLSRTVVKNIKQNLFFAFIYNAIGIPVAAGIFYPISGMVLWPMTAALAMSLSSVSVIGNALRLKKIKV